MPIFKRKKEKVTPPLNLYMPKKKPSNKAVKKKKRAFFLPQRSKVHRKGRKRKVDGSKLPRILMAIFIPIFLVGFSFLLIKAVLTLRNQETVYKKEDVIGIKSIPTYPGSTFMFPNDMNDAYVSNFISSGNSAYKMPDGVNIDDIYTYYNEELPKKGWTYIQTVPIGSEEMKDGMYWQNETGGLRIYSKHKDIWYESISIEEAQSGLKNRIDEKISRDLLLHDRDTQDLLPDFPWVIEIPNEYLISYRSTNFEDNRSVEFKKLGTTESVKLVPIGKYTGQALDVFLRRYVDDIEAEEKCLISTTHLSTTPYSSTLRGTLSCNNTIHSSAVVINSTRNIAYVIDSNMGDTEFFKYVLENLTPQNSLRY